MLELYGAAKVPHRTRDNLARMLGRKPESVHLNEGHVGGGFGIRGELYPEDVLVSLAALRFGRPVKWIEDRREHLMAANHSREQRHLLRAAVDAEGRVLAMDDEFFHSQGAYVRTHGARVPELTAGMLPGPYRVPAFRSTAHFRLTNKTPAATYRAPGRYEGTFVRERLMDAVAAKLGLDRIEVRRRNLIGKEEMPFARGLSALGTDVVLDSGDYAGLLDKALAAMGWDRIAERAAPPSRKWRSGGRGPRLFRRKDGPGSQGRRAPQRGCVRRRRARHGRRFLGAGIRDRDGADLRRCARRRLSPRQRHPRPDRPHRRWRRRACLARHRDDGKRDP